MANGTGFAFIVLVFHAMALHIGAGKYAEPLGCPIDAAAKNGAPNDFIREPHWLRWVVGSTVGSFAQGAAGPPLGGIHLFGSNS